MLLILGVHAWVGLRVLLARHVKGVPGTPLLLLVVGVVMIRGVVSGVVVWIHGLIGVRVVGRRWHRPAHVLMAVVWMRGAPHAVLNHSSVI